MQTSLPHAPQEEILDLLKQDPQAGMCLVVTHYTGLLWYVMEQYIANPEDVKECINDTFTQFYLHWKRFDPGKGSLATFLTAIARNLAISRYRANSIRETSALPDHAPAPDNPISQAETRADIERALAALRPQDAEIIRMKYYHGMTVQEIADSLNLPYETVKKRHQRTLGKLRTLLLGLLLALIIAALAACTYTVLKYFGIVPGYGISAHADIPVYTLTQPIPIQTEYGSGQITDTLLLDDYLYLRLECAVDDMQTWDSLRSSETSIYDDTLYFASIPTTDGQSIRLGSSVSLETEPSPRIIVKTSGQYPAPTDEKTFTLSIEIMGSTYELPMQRTRQQNLKEHYVSFGALGGMLAIPRLENERLIIGLYPLSTGDMPLLTSIIRGINMEGKTANITVTASDGHTLTGECIFSSNPTEGQYFYDWDFGEAKPGKYMLHIPYVYLKQELQQSIPITLDLTQGTWDSTPQQIADGQLAIASCKRLHPAVGQTIPGSTLTAEADWEYWCLKLRYTSETEGLTMTAGRLSASPDMQIQNILAKTGETVMPSGEVYTNYDFTPGFHCGSVTHEPEENCVEFLLSWAPGSCDPSQMMLICSQLSLRWAHPFDIPFSVK